MATVRSIHKLVRELIDGGHLRRRAWGPRAGWQVRLRWWVPPAIVAAVFLAAPLGLSLPAVPLLAVAAAILICNALIATACSRDPEGSDPDRERRLAVLQVALDYAAVFVLIHFTGGLSSPLLYFLSFHVIFAAILFRPRLAYVFAAAAILGMTLHTVGTVAGLWTPWSISGTTIIEEPVHLVTTLSSFTAVVLICAGLVTWIMRRLRERVLALALASDQMAELNEKLASLYAIASTIGLERRMMPVLERAAQELRGVTGAPAVAILLLSPDRSSLRYATLAGLREQGLVGRTIEVTTEGPHRRVLKDKRPAICRLVENESIPLPVAPALAEAGLGAAMLLPLRVERRAIGVLSLYAVDSEDFADADTDFLQLAADLVALTVENARAHEAREKLVLERTRFMLQVTHNLRAPVNAAINMLDALRGGYVGDIVPAQSAYLDRIHHRLMGLTGMVGELLAIAQTRAQGPEFERLDVDPLALAADIDRTFRDTARSKEIELRIEVPPALPSLRGDPHQLQQLLENLVSNAIKYTPRGGTVTLALEPAGARRLKITVRDTGIGIPAAEQDRLFTEFFRASNARKLDEVGTGLGLSIVKQTVEQHGGELHVASREGEGTTFTVVLPLAVADP